MVLGGVLDSYVVLGWLRWNGGTLEATQEGLAIAENVKLD